LLYVEHGLAPETDLAQWQRRLNPLRKRIGGGCHLDRDAPSLVRAAGLDPGVAAQYYLRGVPKTLGYVYGGVATGLTVASSPAPLTIDLLDPSVVA
jgi:hypothetical protein